MSNSAWLRRLMTVPMVGIALGVTSVTFPLALPVALAVDLLRRNRTLGCTRTAVLAPLALFVECVGLVALGGIALTTRASSQARLERTWLVQQHYARAHLAVLKFVYTMRLEIESADLRGPLIVLSRHASLIDVLLPGACVASPGRLKLRYVLKKELLWEPCLDIAGHWLPNHFVDRSGTATQGQLAALRALASGLGSADGLLIYPEGTLATHDKRSRAFAEAKPEDQAYVASLERLLPPRPAGTLALLEGAPEADVLILAHAGLDGLAPLSRLLRGDAVGRTIRVRLRRISRADVPSEPAARAEWLRGVWLEVDAWVRAKER